MKNKDNISIFKEAEDIIKGARRSEYGSPLHSCQHIAKMWNAYLKLDHVITAENVAFMMVLFKMGRESFKHKRDNLVDMLGYIGVAEMVQKGD